MTPFAALLERLAFTPSRNAKLRLIADYLDRTPDPDRGWALAALTGDLKLRMLTPSLLRGMVEERVDAELFRLSYDFVGDLAETIALIWPGPRESDALRLSEVIETLAKTGTSDLPGLIAGWLDRLGPSERYALLKLGTGALRVGVSARLAQTALAQRHDIEADAIGEVWHGLAPPYVDLFAWLQGGPKPQSRMAAPFRPVMLATPTDADALAPLDPADFLAEWKWDGVRVQAVAEGGTRRLYTRRGEDISAAFPDLVAALEFEGVIDGELLVRRDTAVAPFGELQKRLNRKSVGRALLASHPAMLRAYDLLVWGGADLRPEPLHTRRARLQEAVTRLPAERVDLSPEVDFHDWAALDLLRAAPPDPVIEGVMLKRRESPYRAGRPKGPWFKWKREPMVVDAVLLYAQRGHGKRSGYHSDFTFGVWDQDQLVPVGKAYFGFTDAELRELDRFVRANTTDRFGPVRQVAPTLVLEVAFEGLNLSTRHKAGLAMRFPRIRRIRWDKPASEADTLDALRGLLAVS
ncbi:cisplatin damage response ATP-dependent DNA ligase [Pararhodobacter sp. SW119]|uniref:cisplatin damage response ATP-dependent DNA ligase n=1 Tax=Pararhodobacter sp. SW119 TaxID=2780075 RepID=UPI001ADF4048|nr:cisplatin damage response ATP-dependent DNA ligase [Pararhodobacter sp. SW119]